MPITFPNTSLFQNDFQLQGKVRCGPKRSVTSSEPGERHSKHNVNGNKGRLSILDYLMHEGICEYYLK